MSEELYSIVFRGDIVIGKKLPEVKQALLGIFKVDQSRIDSLFTGKPTTLKAGLNRLEAEKYQAVLQKAGIVVSIQSADAPVGKQKVTSKIPKTAPAAAESNSPSIGVSDGAWKLAPVGSLLQDKAKMTNANSATISINTDHLKVMPQEGYLLKENERRGEQTPAVDMSSLEWDLTPYGESLLKAAEKKLQAPANIDTSALSLSDNVGNLLSDNERKQQPQANIDTSHLSLIEEETSDSPLTK